MIFLMTIIFVSCLPTCMGSNCSQQLLKIVISETEYSQNLNKFVWGLKDWTDPSKHKSSNYQYLVYSINNSWETPTNGIQNFSTIASSLIEKFKNFSKQDFISTSVISQEKNATWGKYGFILDGPLQVQVLVTNHSDIGSPRGVSVTEMKERYSFLTKLEPSTLLSKSNSEDHNEVVIAGEALVGASIPKVIGLFFKIDTDGTKYISSKIYKKLVEISQSENIPVVPIEVHYPEITDQPLHFMERTFGQYLIMNLSGTRYIIEAGGQKFTAFRKMGHLDVSDKKHYDYFLNVIKQQFEKDQNLKSEVLRKWPNFNP